MQKPLYLHEELMLLALRNEAGTISGGGMIDYPLAGALVAELILQKRIEIDPAKPKKKLVNLVSATPFGDPLLDESLAKIADARRRASVKTWVMRLAHFKKLKHRIAGQLCKRGILRADEDTVLLIFKRKIYPEVNPEPERKLVERLRTAIFTDANEVDPRTTVLIALAHHGGVLKNDFDKKKLKSRKDRIKEITKGNMIGDSAKDAIDAVHAAVMVAVIIPAIASSAATSGG